MSSQCISERPWKPLPKSVGVHLWFGNILDHLSGAKDPKPKFNVLPRFLQGLAAFSPHVCFAWPR